MLKSLKPYWWQILLALATCIIVTPGMVVAKCPGCPSEESLISKVMVTYFYHADHPEHQKTLRLLQTATANAGYLELVTRDMSIPEIQEIRHVLNGIYGVDMADTDTVPAVFVGQQVFLGYDNIKEGIWPLALARWQESSGLIGRVTAFLRRLRLYAAFAADGILPVVVITAGLIDGVNPCALSLLLFLIACLTMVSQRRKAILVAGSGFLAGSFVTYLLIGMGLLQITGSATFLAISDWVYRGLGIITLALGIASIVDFLRLRTGGLKDMQLQLPAKWKRPMQRLMRSYARAGNIGVLVAFALGALGSLIEFPCTGQIYLPTVSLLGSMGSGVKPFGYLLLYNILFVLPLVLVTIISAYFAESQKVASLYSRYIGAFKLITAALFFFLSAYMFGLLV
jgi:cytochrome c biogenesis protein CcdA